jgi:hypothetical protein
VTQSAPRRTATSLIRQRVSTSIILDITRGQAVDDGVINSVRIACEHIMTGRWLLVRLGDQPFLLLQGQRYA